MNFYQVNQANLMYVLENTDNFFWMISDKNVSNFLLRGDERFDGTKNRRLKIH